MRGETKILLFDSKTGKKVFEHTEENMVTKSLERLLSPKNEWLYGNTTNNLMGGLKEAFPIYSKMLGGILLFDSVMPEDEALVLPPPNVKNVGFAGGEYAGANAFRGSYNSNESGAVTDGYRHVWDFGTDKANTTIHSLSLTSILGGNTGWVHPLTGAGLDTPLISNPTSYLTGGTVWPIRRMKGRALFIKAAKETGENEIITINSGSFYRVKETNFSDLKLLSALNTVDEAGYTAEFLASLPTLPHNYTYSGDRIYYMDGKFHHVYSGDGAVASNAIVHDTYSLDGLKESTKTIMTTASFYGRQSPMFYFKGKYFVCPTSSGTTLSVFGADGTLEGSVSIDGLPAFSSTVGLQNYSGYYIPEIDKMILLQTQSEGNNYGYCYLLDENLTMVAGYSRRSSSGTTGKFIMPVPCEDAISPYCVFSSPDSTSTSYMYLAMWVPYLATINNLTSPVTKTSSHTMKIVYSVYNN